MRPIDADKLKEDVNEWLSYDYKTRVDLTAVKIPNKWLNALIKCIDNQPTVDVLDKIRAEIDGIEINGQIDEHTLFIRSGNEVKKIALDIIDKYRGNKE